jgi:predicted DNA-binding protein (MmcQ/YjbR family)
MLRIYNNCPDPLVPTRLMICSGQTNDLNLAMDMEQLREYCLEKPGATEGFPFGETTLVFKVGEKIFLLAGLDEGTFFNAKADPDKAVEWREQYDEITPGYHMNKKHWNSIRLDGTLKTKFLKEIIDHSYEIVFASLPAKLRKEIEAQQ